MNFFPKIYNKSIFYKLYLLIYNLVSYIKDYNIVAESLYSDSFKKILKSYLNKEFKVDWIGRLYAVINPNLDIQGKFNFNNSIIELDDDYTNNDAYVKNWIYKQLQLVADIFKLQNMYNYISMTLKHVGPKNADNYLVVFDITSRIELVKSFKKFIIQLLIYSLIFYFIYIFIL